MKKLRLALSPIVAAAGILALSGVSVAQMVVVSSANRPQVKATKEKITEDQARDLAQLYADKNLAGYRVVRPSGYGGGYNTVCVRKDPAHRKGSILLFGRISHRCDKFSGVKPATFASIRWLRD